MTALQYLNPIPDWNDSTVIPAIDPGDPVSPERSPYGASLLDIVRRFGHTRARRQLLKGLLDFRSELHVAGFVDGFQWLNGSFAENIELREDRDPCDIDLVTFFYGPEEYDSINTLFYVLDRDRIGETHSIDHYHVALSELSPTNIVERARYWYSVLSHRRRDYLWKGFVEIDLAADGDAEAREELERADCLGGEP